MSSAADDAAEVPVHTLTVRCDERFDVVSHARVHWFNNPIRPRSCHANAGHDSGRRSTTLLDAQLKD